MALESRLRVRLPQRELFDCGHQVPVRQSAQGAFSVSPTFIVCVFTVWIQGLILCLFFVLCLGGGWGVHFEYLVSDENEYMVDACASVTEYL